MVIGRNSLGAVVTAKATSLKVRAKKEVRNSLKKWGKEVFPLRLEEIPSLYVYLLTSKTCVKGSDPVQRKNCWSAVFSR